MEIVQLERVILLKGVQARNTEFLKIFFIFLTYFKVFL